VDLADMLQAVDSDRVVRESRHGSAIGTKKGGLEDPFGCR
jgi:hypothetical protein